MAAPTELTNYEKVIKCVEYRLGQINHANGFYTEKFVVDATDDPALFLVPEGPDWNSCHRFIQMHQDEDEENNLIGNHVDYDHTYFLLVLAEQTLADKNAGLTLKAIRSRIVWDVKRTLRQDVNLNGAATALGFPVNASNGQRLSCVFNHVSKVVSSGTGAENINYPFIRFAIICKFRDKENIQAGIQAG